MGRGRQKAKHTKVARELKYFSPDTDLTALERELGTKSSTDEPDYEDKWADLYSDEDESEEDGSGLDDPGHDESGQSEASEK